MELPGDGKKVSAKVTAATIGGTLGGGSIAVLLIWIMQDALGMSAASFTDERVAAITAICTGVVGFASGYFKAE